MGETIKQGAEIVICRSCFGAGIVYRRGECKACSGSGRQIKITTLEPYATKKEEERA